MPKGELSARAWAALITVYIIWGSTYLAIAYVVRTMPPLLTAGARFLLAGLGMFAIGVRFGDRTDRPTFVQWRSAAVIGTALCLGGNGLVNLAEHRAVAKTGIVALLIATVPLFLALFDFIWFRARLTPMTVAGLVLGFGGAALLSGANSIDGVAALYSVAAAATWAAGSLFARRAPLPRRPAVSTGMEMICGGVALVVAGAAGGEIGQTHLSRATASSWFGFVYLILFGSVIAFTAYVWLLRNVRTTIVGTYAYVNPFVAVLLGSIFLHEQLKPLTAVAGLIIIASVAMIVSKSAAPRDPSPDLGSERIPT